MTKALIYARVSTDEQAEHGYSLRHQIDTCRQYADFHGLEVIGTFTDDYSGMSIERPGFSELLALLADEQADAVIVYTGDRLSRNYVDFLVLRDQWERSGVELHYVDRGKSQNNFEGLLTDGIFALLAHGERLKILKRTSEGRNSKANSGKLVLNGVVPYGYRKVGERKDAELVICEEEARVVRWMFDWYVDGDGQGKRLTLRGIARKLDELGVHTPTTKRKVATRWWSNSVKNILNNPIYTGKGYYGKIRVINGKRVKQPKEEWIEIDVPELAIIEPETFEAAGKRAQKNKLNAKRNKKRKYLLSGHARCGTCNSAMGGTFRHPKENYARKYYQCGTHFKRDDYRCITRHTSYPAERAEELVWEWLVWLLSDDANLEAGIESLIEIRESEVEPKQARLDTITGLVDDLDHRMRRLVDELSNHDDGIVLGVIREKINESKKQREILTSEKVRLEGEIQQVTITTEQKQQIKLLAAGVRDRLPDATYEAKRYFLDLFDVSVFFFNDDAGKRIKIGCNIPLFDMELLLDVSIPLFPQIGESPQLAQGVHDLETGSIVKSLL